MVYVQGRSVEALVATGKNGNGRAKGVWRKRVCGQGSWWPPYTWMLSGKARCQSFLSCLRPHHIPTSPWAVIYGLKGPPGDGAEGSVRPAPGHSFPKKGLSCVSTLFLG